MMAAQQDERNDPRENEQHDCNRAIAPGWVGDSS
jgi:hypothetical protein